MDLIVDNSTSRTTGRSCVPDGSEIVHLPGRDAEKACLIRRESNRPARRAVRRADPAISGATLSSSFNLQYRFYKLQKNEEKRSARARVVPGGYQQCQAIDRGCWENKNQHTRERNRLRYKRERSLHSLSQNYIP